MVQDLRLITESENCRVVCSDSRTPKAWHQALAGRLADACVSSPPYLNNFDYADATRLELYFWGEHRSWQDLTNHVRSAMVRAATHQTTDGATDDARERLAATPAALTKVEALELQLASERAKR